MHVRERLWRSVVGVGMMGIEHIMNLLNIEGVVVTAVADTHPESISKCLKVIQDATSELGGDGNATAEQVRVFRSAKDLFEANVCDIAVVATPNFTHHDVLMTAFETAPDDMHILVEKPLCTTIADCKAVTVAARRRKGIVWVGLEYSYMPPVARVISDTRHGVVGKLNMEPFVYLCGCGSTFVSTAPGLTRHARCIMFYGLVADYPLCLLVFWSCSIQPPQEIRAW
jgi:myo-inositol 2-dehydrogenase / D-chiro-inositol 1-dehydrogenase